MDEYENCEEISSIVSVGEVKLFLAFLVSVGGVKQLVVFLANTYIRIVA